MSGMHQPYEPYHHVRVQAIQEPAPPPSTLATCAAAGHCWHFAGAASGQPPVMPEVCCWCGERRERNLDIPCFHYGHGPYVLREVRP